MSPKTTENVRQLAAKWYYKELFGWDFYSMGGEQAREVFTKALMICAAGDGELSEAEREWVLGRAAAAGAPSEMIESLRSYPASEDINDLVRRVLSTDRSRRAIVYFAIQAASADQAYNDKEQRKVREVAKHMGIPATEVAQLEILIAEEHALRLKRTALCFPDGNPFEARA